MYQYLSAYDHRPPMYNNTCGVERPTEPPTTVPITTIEDVIGGRCHRHVEAETTTVYKITKIVRAIWLTERRVYMRLCKHGWGVKMFCFWRANHASTNSKKFLSWKLDKFTLFAPSLVGWNSENLRKHAVSSSFCLSWHVKREKPVFLESIFISIQELITYTSFVNKTLQLVRISLLVTAGSTKPPCYAGYWWKQN